MIKPAPPRRRCLLSTWHVCSLKTVDLSLSLVTRVGFLNWVMSLPFAFTRWHYCLIPDTPCLSPRFCSSAQTHVTSPRASLSRQVVAVHVHAVCRRVCRSSAAHFYPVQWGAAQLPSQLLHAVAQRVTYPRYFLRFSVKRIVDICIGWFVLINHW